MKIIEKITESVFFKTLIEKINDLIGNSNECKIALDSYNEQLGNLADATPLPANSVSDMTDTTKLYVNISDGYIYRYDGSTFVSTGILYQAVQTGYEKTIQQLQDETLDLIIKVGDYKTIKNNGYLSTNGLYVDTENYHSITTQMIMCCPGTIFKYKGVGRSNAVSVLYYDSDKNVVGYEQIVSTENYTDIMVPSNVSYVCFSSFSQSTEEVVFDLKIEDSISDKLNNIKNDIHDLSNQLNEKSDSSELLDCVKNSYLLDKQTNVINPSNIAPSNAPTASSNGVTATFVDNIITVNGTWSATWNSVITFDYNIPVLGNKRYYLQIWDIEEDTTGLVGAALVVDGSIKCSVKNNATNGTQANFTTSEDGYANIAVRVFPGFSGTSVFKVTLSEKLLEEYEEHFEPYEQVISETIKPSFIPDETRLTGNVLYGKKWAVCGDSFTHGDFKVNGVVVDENPTITKGKYAGKNNVYGYIIGNRNNMEIQHLAVGGRTMATPADGTFTNAFSNEIYKTIDADVDYITLYFGINDSHHKDGITSPDGEDTTGVIELGTIDDTTTSTFYGAWNVVLKYLIENYPNAHIGIIVSNGCRTHEYPTAEIELANKWGVPYIDLNGDERTPMMIRSTNPNKSTVAKMAKLQAWSVNPNSNTHPNSKAHEYESIFIENWLRSL